jgi:hypothetical protein
MTLGDEDSGLSGDSGFLGSQSASTSLGSTRVSKRAKLANGIVMGAQADCLSIQFNYGANNLLSSSK